MVDWIKCVPFVGTTISLVETVQAVAEGNGKKALWKLGETAVGASMDALTVVSLGASAIATTSAKTAAKVAATAAVKNVAGATFVRGVATTYAGKEAEECFGSGGGNDPPRENNPLPREHEIDEDYNDYDEDVDSDVSDPITGVELGDCGRVEELRAQIRFRHLRDGPRRGRGYTERVRRFVERLGRVRGSREVRETDEVGHIIGDLLGGPNDRTYNFFPQSPFCNMEYYHTLERRIYEYLVRQNQAGNGHMAYVDFDAEFVYAPSGDNPNRPRKLRIRVVYSDGREEDFEISNA